MPRRAPKKKLEACASLDAMGCLWFVPALLWILPAWAQSDAGAISDLEVIVVFAIFIVAVIALFLYLARDSLRRIRTDYDEHDLKSKENRDYEKYHSDWQDDYQYDSANAGGRRRDAGADGDAAGRQVPDYYKVLDVPRDATVQQIKERYRQLARSRHPDVSGEDSAEEMARINEAYRTLSDERRRAQYDSTSARGEI